MTGLGFGAYNELSFQLLAETPGALLEEHTQESLIEGRQVHNAYLEVLAEMGVVGVLFFLLLLVGIPVELRRAARLAGSSSLLRSICGALICGAAGFVVASVFLSSNNNRALWFLVGMTLALGTMAKRLTEHELEPEGV
jgi:O-antigen ligase